MAFEKEFSVFFVTFVVNVRSQAFAGGETITVGALPGGGT
jgi:hypothetical protein